MSDYQLLWAQLLDVIHFFTAVHVKVKGTAQGTSTLATETSELLLSASCAFLPAVTTRKTIISFSLNG